MALLACGAVWGQTEEEGDATRDQRKALQSCARLRACTVRLCRSFLVFLFFFLFFCLF
jgi:hypothetical protein